MLLDVQFRSLVLLLAQHLLLQHLLLRRMRLLLCAHVGSHGRLLLLRLRRLLPRRLPVLATSHTRTLVLLVLADELPVGDVGALARSGGRVEDGLPHGLHEVLLGLLLPCLHRCCC